MIAAVVLVLAVGGVAGWLATRGGSSGGGSDELRSALRLLPADLTEGKVEFRTSDGPSKPHPDAAFATGDPRGTLGLDMAAARWELDLDGGEGSGGSTEALVAYGYRGDAQLSTVVEKLRGHGLSVTTAGGVQQLDAPDSLGDEAGWEWTGVYSRVFVNPTDGWIAFTQGDDVRLPADHPDLDAIATQLPGHLVAAQFRIGAETCVDVSEQHDALQRATKFSAAGVGMQAENGKVTAALAFPDAATAKLNAGPRAAAAGAATHTAGRLLVLSGTGDRSDALDLAACPA